MLLAEKGLPEGGSVGYENSALGIDPIDGRLIVAAVNALEPHLARIAELERGLKEALTFLQRMEDSRDNAVAAMAVWSEDDHRGIDQLRALAGGKA